MFLFYKQLVRGHEDAKKEHQDCFFLTQKTQTHFEQKKVKLLFKHDVTYVT